MILIDTHCHLYLPKFDSDLDEVLNRAAANGIDKIFLPAIDAETHDKLLKLADRELKAPNGTAISKEDFEILPMMGVHPCSIKENFEEGKHSLKNVEPVFEIKPNESGQVNVSCGYNPEQLFDSNLPTNYPAGNCEKDPSLRNFNQNLF